MLYNIYMNIEVYEKKRKESLWAKKQKKVEKTNEEPKFKETKEVIEKETKEARKLCAEYHRKLDKSGYFNSKAMDKAKNLLSKFTKLDSKKLPPSVQAVVKHRTEYLRLMAGLSQNHNIRDFIDKFEPGVGNMGLFGGDIKRIEKMAQETEEFKRLKEEDINFAIQKLRIASVNLRPLASKGNFGSRAKKYLIPPNVPIKDIRCDDAVAAKRLSEGINVLRKNLARLYRTKKVLNAKEAPEKAKKTGRKAV